MSEVKKCVRWEKWIDPFLTNLSEVEHPGMGDDDDDDNPIKFKDSYQKLEEGVKNPPKKIMTGPVMVGPMGIVPLNENNIPSKIYCFWMGHTNFDITNKVARTIEETPGVEALDIFSRYRFRIAIGKAFLDEETDPFGRKVMDAIVERICPKEKPKDIKQEEIKVEGKVNRVPLKESNLKLLKTHLKSKYQHWFIFVNSDGTLATKGGPSEEELKKEAETNQQNLVAASWE